MAEDHRAPRSDVVEVAPAVDVGEPLPVGPGEEDRLAADAAEAETAAGKFTGCLKVREETQGFDSWRFDYYCPGVGRALTTVAGTDFENPNTELLSYE